MIFLNFASSAAALVFFLPGVWTHNDIEIKQSPEYFKIFGKKSNIYWTPCIKRYGFRDYIKGSWLSVPRHSKRPVTKIIDKVKDLDNDKEIFSFIQLPWDDMFVCPYKVAENSNKSPFPLVQS